MQLLGIGNRLVLVDEEIEENLRKVQLQNGMQNLEGVGGPAWGSSVPIGMNRTV